MVGAEPAELWLLPWVLMQINHLQMFLKYLEVCLFPTTLITEALVSVIKFVYFSRKLFFSGIWKDKRGN